MRRTKIVLLIVTIFAGLLFAMWMVNDSTGTTTTVSSDCSGNGCSGSGSEDEDCDCGCEDECYGETISVSFSDDDGNDEWGWNHIESKHIDGTHTETGSLFPSGTDKSMLSGILDTLACEDDGTEDKNCDGKEDYYRRWTFSRKVIVNGVCGEVTLVATKMTENDDYTVTSMHPEEKMNPNDTSYPGVMTDYSCDCVCNQTSSE